ncbi:hypothetical protein [Methylotenera mobilis]|jgi:hypothetical protein|uniref:hypothetical protein n=1 Tax=Methylotenera mobilis TaxID=359408 RepID=UPI000368638D|nr:hypothetical protein [Methylotenera mobilis]
MKKIILLLSLMTLLVSCSSHKTEGVKEAEGETPVKVVICGAGESNCFVAARFKDLDGCESHKRWAEMLCDTQSNPEKMVCEKDNGAKVTYAYCTL